MTPRRILRQCYHQVTHALGRVTWLHPTLRPLHRLLARRAPWTRNHPFDAANGVRTSGYVPPWLLGTGNQGYGGCQPSALRHALATLPDPNKLTFLDLGCGKGRALVVASEMPFARIVGIEIDRKLCRDARANAAAIHTRYPGRTTIEVEAADAATVTLPTGDLVAFLFHPFSLPLLELIIDRLVRHVAALTVIYQNPAGAAVLDADPRLRRWFADTVACTACERGFGPADRETIVCWVRRDESAPSYPGCDRPVVVTPVGARLAQQV